jgi:hypothetical protein
MNGIAYFARRGLGSSGLALCVLVLASPRLAAPLTIDFRSPPFGPREGNLGVTTVAETVSGIDVTVSSLTDDNLYRDSVDGFGIWGGENDEIDARNWPWGEWEVLRVTFSPMVTVESILVTDLFYGLPDTSPEVGYYSADNVTWVQFVQNLQHLNGELLLDGLALRTTHLYFSAFRPGYPYRRLDDFSVAQIEVAPIPEPVTLCLVAVGATGLMLRRKGRRS